MTLFNLAPRQSVRRTIAVLIMTWGLICNFADESWSADPAVSVHVDMDAFAKSELGQLLISAGSKIAASEMDKDPKETMDAIVESLGFDPMEQRAKFSVDLVDLENPLQDLKAVLSLKDSTGNLEGLLLAAPGYTSINVDGKTIHSISPDGKTIFIVFGQASDGTKQVIAAASQAVVTDAIRNAEPVDWSLQDGQFVNVKLLSPPMEMIAGTPLVAVADMLAETSISLGESGDSLQIQIQMTTSDDRKATQLQQLAQGLVAMVGLFKDEIRKGMDDKKTAQQMISAIDQIEVTKNGNVVNVDAKIPRETVLTFLREEADLPL